jgi:hypothetical protein
MMMIVVTQQQQQQQVAGTETARWHGNVAKEMHQQVALKH